MGGNCERFSVCTRFSDCYLALKGNVWSIRRKQNPPKKIRIAGLVWKDRSLLFFILLCSDLIREKQTRACRHGPCVSLLTLKKSYFALCWYWHPCKNVVVRCPGGSQWRRCYGGEGQLAGHLTLRLEHLLGSGSKRTWWHQPRQTLPVSYPLSALIFSMFSVLFFIQSKKKLKN